MINHEEIIRRQYETSKAIEELELDMLYSDQYDDDSWMSEWDEDQLYAYQGYDGDYDEMLGNFYDEEEIKEA